MRVWQEGVHRMVRLVESEGVGARLRLYRFNTPHAVRLEDFDLPGVPNRYIEMPPGLVEEDDIGRAGELSACQLNARPGIEHDKGAIIASAE
jgi:hypothetical protein